MTAAGTAAPIERLLESLADAPERFPAALLLTASSEARLEKESRRSCVRERAPTQASKASHRQSPARAAAASTRESIPTS
jgi:hypothetical protein